MPGDPNGFGQYVKRNGSNLYLAGDQDFTSATALIVPASAGYAPTADASLGYDTTDEAFVGGGNGVAGKFPRVIYQDDDVATAGNSLDAGTISTTETIFASKYTVPANFMVSKKLLRVSWMIEQVVPATAATTLMRLRWGGLAGTILMGGTAQSPGINTTNTMMVICHILATAGPGAAVNLHSTYSTGASQIAGLRPFTAQPVAAATNASADLVLTVTYGAATAGNINKCHMLLVEELN